MSLLHTGPTTLIRRVLPVLLVLAQLALSLHWAEHHANTGDWGTKECAACHVLASSADVAAPVLATPAFVGVVELARIALEIPRALSGASYRPRAPPVLYI